MNVCMKRWIEEAAKCHKFQCWDRLWCFWFGVHVFFSNKPSDYFVVIILQLSHLNHHTFISVNVGLGLWTFIALF